LHRTKNNSRVYVINEACKTWNTVVPAKRGTRSHDRNGYWKQRTRPKSMPHHHELQDHDIHRPGRILHEAISNGTILNSI
jgi:hypothetical protein